VQPLLKHVVGDAAHVDELLEDGLAKGVHVVRIGDVAKAVLESALKEELGEFIQQLFEAEAVERRWDPFCVFRYRHNLFLSDQSPPFQGGVAATFKKMSR